MACACVCVCVCVYVCVLGTTKDQCPKSHDHFPGISEHLTKIIVAFLNISLYLNPNLKEKWCYFQDFMWIQVQEECMLRKASGIIITRWRSHKCF